VGNVGPKHTAVTEDKGGKVKKIVEKIHGYRRVEAKIFYDIMTLLKNL
jgi:hypothetical protein